MTNIVTKSEFQGTDLILASDGGVLLPTSPEVARSRLALLSADKAVTDALLDPRNPAHQLRSAERAGLLQIASKAAGALPATPKV